MSIRPLAFLTCMCWLPSLAAAATTPVVVKDGNGNSSADEVAGTTVVVVVSVSERDCIGLGPTGLNAITFQVIIDGWTPGDSVLAFEPSLGVGLNDNGRTNPFATQPMTTASASGQLHAFVGASTVRFAGENCVTPTTNLAWGVSAHQPPLDIAGPLFNSDPTVQVLRFEFQIDPLSTYRTITISVPDTLIDGGTMSWYTSADGTSNCVTPIDAGDVTPLVISVFPACDSIDFNNDSLFPDTADIDDFLSVFSGGPCSNDPLCNDIDFNNDTLFPDTLDIDSLLSVFSGGGCLR